VRKLTSDGRATRGSRWVCIIPAEEYQCGCPSA
jgi:hypothetical protein